MTTKNKSIIGIVTIFGGSKLSLYFGPLKGEVDHDNDNCALTFNEQLCGRAVTQLAAGFVSAVWLGELTGKSHKWTDGDYVTVGLEQWRVRIVKRLPKKYKGKWAVASTDREILICRGNAGDMAMGAMLGVDHAWNLWEKATLKAALQMMPEQLPATDCAAWEQDWKAVVAKLTEAA